MAKIRDKSKWGQQAAFPNADGETGLTKRDWLIGQIASGMRYGGAPAEMLSVWIVEHADAICAEMERGGGDE